MTSTRAFGFRRLLRCTGRMPLWFALFASACTPRMPSDATYYSERIEPIFVGSCQGRAGGCHVATEDGSAPGNLSLESYDSLMRRRDVLVTYGPYPVPTLFLEAGAPVTVPVAVLDPPDPSRPDERVELVSVDVRHAGGRTFDPSSLAFLELRTWMERGAMRNGTVRPATTTDDDDACVHTLGSGPGFDAAVSPADTASFDTFVSEVGPTLTDRCAAGGCHGAPLADLHLTCGETLEEQRWNYYIATQFLSDPVRGSELLRRPIAPERGGAFHVGGAIFGSTDDAQYRGLVSWAEATVAADPAHFRESDATPGYRFFSNRVLPVLVREGCMALACHSPIGLRFPLRGGSRGAFSTYARRLDYALARNFLALESPDPTRSRIIEKNLEPAATVASGRGLLHRGGALFIDAGAERCADFDARDQPLSEVPSLCILEEWHRIERDEAIARGEVRDAVAPVDAVVWIERPLGVGTPTDFSTYRPGADLRIADAGVASGALALGAARSLLADCGLPAGTSDVRDPAVSWDGTRIAFAARSSASEPLRLYWAAANGTGCEPIPGVATPYDDENGILIHDFDPAFAPDGTLVFASTRGNLDRALYAYAGPTRTPARLEPNANLYVLDPAAETLRQLTFLLDQEIAPSFMGDGHVIYTAEKRTDDFHVLALRRHLLDGGDYHPLYASRDSLGFDSATEVVELVDLRFAFVAAPLDSPDGAGSIAIFDRSIGPDEAARDPEDRAYLHSLSEMASGTPRGGDDGAFRSPSPLPTGRLLVACALGAGAAAPFDFDLCELEPRDGSLRVLLATAGRAELDAVAVYARMRRPIARSDGREIDHPVMVPGATDSVVRFTDFPMIASLMFENTRNGRAIDRRIGGFEVLEWFPPPAGVTSFAELPASALSTDSRGTYFRERRSLGWAPLFADGSARIRLPGGVPVSFAPTDAEGSVLEFLPGSPFTGAMVQREAEQYYPGERISRSVPRRFFNSLCAGCHGSISGRELDVGVDLDVLSGASRDMARTADADDLFGGH